MRYATLLLVLAVLAGCNKQPDNTVVGQAEFRKDGSLDFLRPDGNVITTIDIEVVGDRESQARGLMGRRSLPSRGGMFFVYDAPKDQSFWMKNTPLPLDIIFIGSDSSVVNIAKRTKPLSSATIESISPAQFVLEVRGGFTDRLGIDDSTRFRWTIDS
ncbi:MAG: DUF192 domain-containing protein [Rhodothermales bacterium]|nr:DUF192 domain-containing protein [Rhodothermales bacterium]